MLSTSTKSSTDVSSTPDLSPCVTQKPVTTTILRPTETTETKESLDKDSLKPVTTTTMRPTETTETQELLEKAETFWPLLRTSMPYAIQIPLSFRLSGTYGYGQDTIGESSGGTGVISTSYFGTPYRYGQSGLYGKSGLAGSSYGSYAGYGTRIYGNQGGAAWSGWGNGKWGKYGKG